MVENMQNFDLQWYVSQNSACFCQSHFSIDQERMKEKNAQKSKVNLQTINSSD